jgi:site-specific DNA-methyltransferase (adenine-specific)
VTPYYSDDAVTLWHGDCRELLPEMGGVSVMVTDPPYGDTSLDWDTWPTGWLTAIHPDVNSLWCFGSMRMFFTKLAEFDGWTYAQEIVWRKHAGSGFQADRFKRVHEFAVQWYRGQWTDVYKVPQREATTTRTQGVVNKSADRAAQMGGIGASAWVDDGTRLIQSVISIRSMHRMAIHPTEKPIGIIDPLLNYSVPLGGTVLDPFAGSGSTLAAAKASGRKAIGIEINERYCELAATRLSQGVLDFGSAS